MLGGVVGYLIGALLYDSLGHWVIQLYGYGEKFEAFREMYAAIRCVDHPAEGPHADPLQARDHLVRVRRLQFLLFVVLSLHRRAARASSCSPSCCTAMAPGRAKSSRSGSDCWTAIGAGVLVIGFIVVLPAVLSKLRRNGQAAFWPRRARTMTANYARVDADCLLDRARLIVRCAARAREAIRARRRGRAAAQRGPPSRAVAPASLPTPQETFGAIGKFIDQSISNVGAGVRGAGETLGATTNAAGDLAKGVSDAAGTVARLPGTNVVAGHELCAIAPNGAPDCDGASLALCKSKGFARGNSARHHVVVQVPGADVARGARAEPQECKDESFVSRAICQ